MRDPQAQADKGFLEYVLPGTGAAIFRAWCLSIAFISIALGDDSVLLWTTATIWVFITVIESFAWMVRP